MSPAARAANFWTWLGLALFVVGAALWVLPLLPATPAAGGALRGLPLWPQWATAAVAGLGLGILIGAARKNRG